MKKSVDKEVKKIRETLASISEFGLVKVVVIPDDKTKDEGLPEFVRGNLRQGNIILVKDEKALYMTESYFKHLQEEYGIEPVSKN